MVKGKKTIFTLLLAMILSIISVGIICMYDDVAKRPIEDKTDVSAYLGRTMLYFMLDQARLVDDDYEVIYFGEKVPNSIRSEIEYIIEEEMLTARARLGNDSNFQYLIKNTKTGKNAKSKVFNLSQENSILYTKFLYQENGAVTSSGDYISTDFTYISIYQLLRSSMSIYVDTETDSYIIRGTYSIPREQLKINVPSNLEVTYCIPQNIIENDGEISSQYLHDWGNAEVFLLIVYIAMAVIIGLFIIIYPIETVQEINPYAFMRKIKAGIKWCFLILAITMSVMGAVILSGYTIIGDTQRLIEAVGIPYAGIMTLIINFVMITLTGLFMSMGFFELKYMITSGFVRYIKEDTLAGTFCRWLKKNFDKLSDIDLSDNMDKTIVKYVLVNVAVIIVLVCFWGFGVVLAVIYGFVSFFYIKGKAKKCQNDYNVMLTASHELAEGKFDTEISKDVGIFNGIRDEFKNIRIGFQKAVNEEIKSQNMKTELISNVSHDLKTPLTGIKNYVELLQDESIDEETRKKYLDTLNNYTDRLSTLIEDLFEVSKVNSGNIKLNLIELNIVELVKQAEAETQELLNERGLDVIINAQDNDIRLILDGDKTYRIFENLFTNIGKYALSNTRVYVDIAEEEQYVEIIFKNISEMQMNFTPEEIVERFVRGDKSRHENGSGLGLAIIKSFTEVQNGEFHIEIDGDLFKAVVRFAKKFS